MVRDVAGAHGEEKLDILRPRHVYIVETFTCGPLAALDNNVPSERLEGAVFVQVTKVRCCNGDSINLIAAGLKFELLRGTLLFPRRGCHVKLFFLRIPIVLPSVEISSSCFVHSTFARISFAFQKC